MPACPAAIFRSMLLLQDTFPTYGAVDVSSRGAGERREVPSDKGRCLPGTFVAAMDLSRCDGMEVLPAMRACLGELEPLRRVIEALLAFLAAKLGAPELLVRDRAAAYLAAPACNQVVADDVVARLLVGLTLKTCAFVAAELPPCIRLWRHQRAASDAAVRHIQRVDDLTARSSSIALIALMCE